MTVEASVPKKIRGYICYWGHPFKEVTLPGSLPVEKDQFYYHTDHLGSSNIITDTIKGVTHLKAPCQEKKTHPVARK